MRICKTTLWIKKSGSNNKEMTVTSFGPFRPVSQAGKPADDGSRRKMDGLVLTGGWGFASYVNVIYIDMGLSMDIAAKLDDIGKPAWIGVMVLGFILFWPVGLAILAYLIWSGRMSCGKHGGAGRWYGMENRQSRWCGGWRRAQTSGN